MQATVCLWVKDPALWKLRKEVDQFEFCVVELVVIVFRPRLAEV